MLRRPSVVVVHNFIVGVHNFQDIFLCNRLNTLRKGERKFVVFSSTEPKAGGKNNCVFCFDRIRTLAAMAIYVSHRLIMEKSENCQFLLSCWRYLNNCQFLLSCWRYLNFVFAEMFIE